jgi:hypothetical protein
MAETEIATEAWSHPLHPIFARCVEPSHWKFDLSRPYTVDGFLYATDARIAVRMPVPGWWTIPNPENLPPPGLLLDLFGRGDWSRNPWRAEPVTFPTVEGACEACLGAKVLPEVACPWCGGDSPGPYEAAFCDECWQLEGKIPAGPCHGCGGSGILDWSGRLEVTPGYWLQRRYVALLHEFEMTTYLPVKLDAKHVTRFTLGDITGVLMPMTRPDPGRRAR